MPKGSLEHKILNENLKNMKLLFDKRQKWGKNFLSQYAKVLSEVNNKNEWIINKYFIIN